MVQSHLHTGLVAWHWCPQRDTPARAGASRSPIPHLQPFGVIGSLWPLHQTGFTSGNWVTDKVTLGLCLCLCVTVWFLQSSATGS